MKNVIIIGAGPGLSQGIAEKFGQEGFAIGLMSRTAQKLEQATAALRAKGITAYFATADAYDKTALASALQNLREQMGSIHTLVYNAAALKQKNILEETTEALVEDFKISVAHALHAVQTLRDDLQAQKGAVLLTGGGFALQPSPDFGSLSLGKAALRNLAFQLNTALQPSDIYVGTVTINGYIQHESPTHSPRILAEQFWKLHQARTLIELQH